MQIELILLRPVVIMASLHHLFDKQSAATRPRSAHEAGIAQRAAAEASLREAMPALRAFVDLGAAGACHRGGEGCGAGGTGLQAAGQGAATAL